MPKSKHRKDQKKKSRARTEQIQGQQKNMQAKLQELFMKQLEEIKSQSSGETENQSIQDAELIQSTTEL
jgi:hypothetical protein